MSRFRSDILAALGFLLLPLVLFWPVTLGGRTLIPADNLFAIQPWAAASAQFDAAPPETPHNDLLSDLLLENYPWKRFIINSLKNGELPLWNPHQFAGAPFLAAGQHSALYPFSALFYVLPLPSAYGWFIVSQFFLAGLLAYIFLRSLGQSRLAAFAGGLIYEFSLFMIVSVVFPMIVAGAVWLPLVLTCVDGIVQQRPALGGRAASLPWVVIGGAALGFQILAGHPEVVYYTLLIAGGYSAFNLIGAFLNRKGAQPPVTPCGEAARSLHTEPRDSSPRLARLGMTLSDMPSALRAFAARSSRPSFYLLLMVALGLALGAVQLVPLFEVVQFNFRAGAATLEQVRGWGYPLRHVLAFFVPNIFGNPSHHGYFDLFSWQWTPVTTNALGQQISKVDWGIKNYVEGGGYVGILPMILALFGVFSMVKPSAVSGQRSAVSTQQSKIFFTLLAGFSLAFAFGTPLYAMIYYLPGLNQIHSPFRWVWPFTLAAAALAGFGLDYLRRRKSRAAAAASAAAGLSGTAVLAGLIFIRLNFDAFEPGLRRLLAELALASGAFADARMFFSYEARWLAQFALLLIAAAVVMLLAAQARAVWTKLAVGLIAADLLIAGAGFNAAADPAILSYVPPVVNFLRQDTTHWRFTTYDPFGQKPFNANVGWMFDLYDVRGYDSIIPKQYADYMALIQPQGELQYNRIAPVDNPSSLDSPLLDLLNVKYVISLTDIQSPKYKLVYDAEVKVYQNLGAAPRAFTLPAGCAFSTPDFASAVRSYDPRQYVIFGPDAGLAAAPILPPSECAFRPADISAYGGSEVRVNVSAAEDSYLILADSYFKDWRAFVRPLGADEKTEKEVPLLRADGNFRAVRVRASGEAWMVRFKYSPNAVKFGGFTTAIAALALAMAVGMWLWRYFYPESAEDSTARRVAKNSLAPMALTLMNRAIDLVFAAFMLRLLGPGDAGKYYFAGVLITWFEIWTNFGLNTYLTREVARDRLHANRYLSNTTILRLALGAVSFPVLALIMLGLSFFSRLEGDTALAIVLLAIGLAPSSVSTGLTALFYAYEKAEYPAAITTVTTLLKVTFGALALLLGYSFVGLAAVTIIVNTITMTILIALVIRLFFRPRFEFERPLQREMIRESWPLMLNHLLATLFFKVDVTLLQPIRGEVEVGWYSTAYKFIEAFNIIPSFFTFALFPVMSRQAREDRPALLRSYSLAVKLLFSVAVPLAVATTFLARALIGLLAGEAYLPHGATALVLMVWSIPVGWTNSVTNYVLIALGQQRSLTRAFLIGLAFNVVCNIIFLPVYGYPAAAVITILSEIVEGIPFYITLHHSLAPIPWFKLLWRPALGGAIMFGAAWAGWQVHPLLGLAGGAFAYVILIAGLKTFDAEELEQFISVLPSGLRGKLARKARVEPEVSVMHK